MKISEKKGKNCMVNNDNSKNKKKVPYFKRKDSLYQKYPILAWSITIIAIVVGLYMMANAFNIASNNASYNAGYKSVYQK